MVSANFDAGEFPEPLELDLTRQPNRHLTFATGPHLCMGAHIARLELRVLFEELLTRTRSIELEGPMDYATRQLRPRRQTPRRAGDLKDRRSALGCLP